jgi:predicted DNA-binding protein
MPSKHTVVVSLDDETDQILKGLDSRTNRSEWIREAIKWRHTSDVEILQALADARSRRIEHMLRTIRRVYYMAEEGLLGSHLDMDAIKQLKELDY